MLIFLLLSLNFIHLKADPLTFDENGMRSILCGKEKLPYYPTETARFEVDSNSWLVKVSAKTPSSKYLTTSIGSFISPRHIVTSAQMVAEPHVTGTEKWVMDGEQVRLDENCEGDDDMEDMIREIWSNIRKVPEKYVLNLNITSLNCERADSRRECEMAVYTPVKAWMLGLCPIFKDLIYFAPLVIEVEESGPSYGCLADMIVPEAAAVHDFHLYGLDLMKEGLRYDKAKLSSSPTEHSELLVLSAPNFKQNYNRGGPMIREIDGKQYIYGFRSGSFDTGLIYFYDVRRDFYRQQICQVSGVCPVQPGEYTLPSTLETTSTTASPSTATLVKTTSESLKATDPSYYQLQEHENELEKVPEDEEDYREDTDFHVDEDFLNGGKMRKWVFELMFLLVFWAL